MIKITWQEKTSVILDSFQANQISSSANGGNTYDFQALQVLKGSFSAAVDPVAVLGNESKFAYYRKMRKHYPETDIVVRAAVPLVFGPLRAATHTAAIVHHIDDEIGASSFFHRFFFRRFKKRLCQQEMVITVSQYWKEYLEKLGCNNVRVIYNSFDLRDYDPVNDSGSGFRSANGFDTDRPLVYLGNASRQKGVYEAYEALKEMNVQMLMTGVENRAPDLPVRFLSLERKEYIRMLQACDLVIANSRLIEGWNRVAHEALLCGTPVVGSGTGGMKELLEGAGQIIATSSSELKHAVETVLSRKEDFGGRGRKYLVQFDIPYFTSAWVNAMQELSQYPRR